MSEDDRNLSKDALDENEYYSTHEHPYKNQDNINDQEIIRNREDEELQKRKENFEKDKQFYFGKDTKKIDEQMIQRDLNRDFEKEKRIRKTSAEIARETYSGNI